MWKKGRESVEVDVEKLIEVLKRAYTNEWIAFFDRDISL
jgi:ferritin-like protein